ncbi:GNAT family N-acetyltransferase [Amycolatopsis sp. OK19-0408]|uniref:GNAT family N-acetyltransferase n=1 Tax=Amycolatopsis iheyensis TaxID=2945988 RepID=A0A9X2N9A9_9PSEU|nr:GNAT family N-acetyltransferase [Amycolatopsis iheyensis]MCR6482946.1 GNAT family N-acetyltransferase [Amycolatopsis iheyensis]
MRLADAARLTGLLTQLGYPADVDTVTGRLAVVLASATQRVLVAATATGIAGYVGVERRSVMLHQDERAEITGLVVAATARRAGVGHALVRAAERWAAELGLRTVVVRSNVARPESHPFYEGIGYRRMSTSHTYRKDFTAAGAP